MDQPVILVIEDEEVVVKLLCEILLRANCQPIVGRNGAEGLELWQKHRDEIDLVISDMRMPGRIQGPEVVRTIKTDSPQTMVFACSGTPDDAIDCGADKILAKPVEPLRLLETINDFLPPGKKAFFLHARDSRKNVVLLVDNSRVSRHFFTEMVNRINKDLFVLCAATGQEAISLWEMVREETKLVILDHFLPDMMGSDVLKAIKIDRPEIPFIVTTAETISHSQYGGARFFLAKPLEEGRDEVEAAIKDLFGIM